MERQDIAMAAFVSWSRPPFEFFSPPEVSHRRLAAIGCESRNLANAEGTSVDARARMEDTAFVLFNPLRPQVFRGGVGLN